MQPSRRMSLGNDVECVVMLRWDWWGGRVNEILCLRAEWGNSRPAAAVFILRAGAVPKPTLLVCVWEEKTWFSTPEGILETNIHRCSVENKVNRPWKKKGVTQTYEHIFEEALGPNYYHYFKMGLLFPRCYRINCYLLDCLVPSVRFWTTHEGEEWKQSALG